MYALGVPYVQVIDDNLLMGSCSDPAFARPGKDGSLVGPLVEKALAKLYGNYAHLIEGKA
jgi:hypothetical protein